MRPRAGVYSSGIPSHLCAKCAHRWGTHVMIHTRATRPNISTTGLIDSGWYPSMLFHEGLHGKTGIGDGTPFRQGLCQMLGVDRDPNHDYSNCVEETKDITKWLENVM